MKVKGKKGAEAAKEESEQMRERPRRLIYDRRYTTGQPTIAVAFFFRGGGVIDRI